MEVIFDSKMRSITFGELQVGDTFLDDDGDLCIKTTSDPTQNLTSAIYFSEGEWYEAICRNDDKVIPVKAMLQIEN